MGNNTKREKIYKYYLMGLDAMQVAQNLNVPFSLVKNYYSDFMVAAAKIKSNSNEDRIFQVRMIEKELFENIALFLRNPTAELNNIITQLQDSYSRFNALI